MTRALKGFAVTAGVMLPLASGPVRGVTTTFTAVDHAWAAGLYKVNESWSARPVDSNNDRGQDVWIGYNNQGGSSQKPGSGALGSPHQLPVRGALAAGCGQDVDMLADAGRDGKCVMTYTKLWTDADAATSEAWYWFALTSFLLGTDGIRAWSRGREPDRCISGRRGRRAFVTLDGASVEQRLVSNPIPGRSSSRSDRASMSAGWEPLPWGPDAYRTG